jgi:hypothetical protein
MLMDDLLDASMMGGMVERMMGNELSLNNMYACPQLDTCHVGSYFVPLVPIFRI